MRSTLDPSVPAVGDDACVEAQPLAPTPTARERVSTATRLVRRGREVMGDTRVPFEGDGGVMPSAGGGQANPRQGVTRVATNGMGVSMRRRKPPIAMTPTITTGVLL